VLQPTQSDIIAYTYFHFLNHKGIGRLLAATENRPYSWTMLMANLENFLA